MAPKRNDNDPPDVEDTLEFKFAILKQRVDGLEKKAMWVAGAAWGVVLWVLSMGPEIIRFLKGFSK